MIFNFFFVEMILKFQKEINAITYNAKLKKIKFESFHLNKISIKYEFKVYVFVMFKMKYFINRMQCNILSQ